MAISLGDTFIHETSTYGGSSFSSHSTNTQTLNKINQQKWDYVVIQAQSQEPALSPRYVNAKVFPAAQVLIDAIERTHLCIEPLFFMTWGRKFGDASNCVSYPPVCTYLGMQERLRTRYLDMSFFHNASCSPVGMVWKESIAIDSSINLYSSDNSHPSIFGSYLAACTFYASIFKRSAVGSSYWSNTIDSVTAYSLQQIGSSEALDNLEVWNIFNADFSYVLNNDSISFFNLSSDYESVAWDFGDGASSFVVNPTHVYNSSGSYTISLSIFTNGGCLLDTFSITVTVSPTTLINDLKTPKELISITDILGKNSAQQKHTPLFYHFNDGTVQKKIVIE